MSPRNSEPPPGLFSNIEIEKNLPGQILSGEVYQINLSRSLDPILARATVHRLAAELGYSLADQVRPATAVFQIAWDFVTFAGQGKICISWQENADRCRGLRINFSDNGKNTDTLALMLKTGGGFNTRDRLNYFGLKHLVDEYEIGQDSGQGNSVTIIKWLE
jgi:serine/threonine-protein kinase RsbT